MLDSKYYIMKLIKENQIGKYTITECIILIDFKHLVHIIYNEMKCNNKVFSVKTYVVHALSAQGGAQILIRASSLSIIFVSSRTVYN